MIGCRVAVLRSHWTAVPTPLFDSTAAACLLHLPVVEGLIFCISATPHLETSFPLFHGQGHEGVVALWQVLKQLGINLELILTERY